MEYVLYFLLTFDTYIYLYEIANSYFLFKKTNNM